MRYVFILFMIIRYDLHGIRFPSFFCSSYFWPNILEPKSTSCLWYRIYTYLFTFDKFQLLGTIFSNFFTYKGILQLHNECLPTTTGTNILMKIQDVKFRQGWMKKNSHQMFHNRNKNSDKYVIVIILTEAISSVNKSKKRNENRLNLYLVAYKYFSLFCLW